MAAQSQMARQPSNAYADGFEDLKFDQYGFLIEPEDWSECVADYIAGLDGISPLGWEHWNVIYFLRDRYLQFGAILPLRNLCRGVGVSRERLKELFGSCRTIWRVAGLPDPGEEARNHFM